MTEDDIRRSMNRCRQDLSALARSLNKAESMFDVGLEGRTEYELSAMRNTLEQVAKNLYAACGSAGVVNLIIEHRWPSQPFEDQEGKV